MAREHECDLIWGMENGPNGFECVGAVFLDCGIGDMDRGVIGAPVARVWGR